MHTAASLRPTRRDYKASHSSGKTAMMDSDNMCRCVPGNIQAQQLWIVLVRPVLLIYMLLWGLDQLLLELC